jgi:hypothetical protein
VPDEKCVVLTGLGRELRDLAWAFASKKAGAAFLGYMQQQRQRLMGERGQMNVKRPELIERYGFDTKYAGHIIRLGFQGIDYMQTGAFPIPMPDEQRDFILAVRTGQVSENDVLTKAGELEAELKDAIDGSPLDEQPDYEAVNAFLRGRGAMPERRESSAATTVAALYVEKDGAYFGLPGVDPWDEERDARLYAGPWPVVAHPPCRSWSIMGQCRPEIVRGEDGGDEGCFEAALRAVQTYGGVLEHPARSRAWSHFGLPKPGAEGWYGKLFGTTARAAEYGESAWEVGRHGEGWSCEVDQRWYGHDARKPTWLYFVGGIPPELRWGRGPKGDKTIGRSYGQGRSHLRSRTPDAFRDVLLDMARRPLPVRAGT